FWPPKRVGMFKRFASWVTRGRYQPANRDDDPRFEDFNRTQPANWFLAWYRHPDGEMRELIKRGTINRDNYLHFMYEEVEGEGQTPLEELSANERAAIAEYGPKARAIALGASSNADALTAQIDREALLFSDAVWADTPVDEDLSEPDEPRVCAAELEQGGSDD
ncbi:MAG: hypothetical protein AAF202_12875, partial [Pseudomonadota bacterium]